MTPEDTTARKGPAGVSRRTVLAVGAAGASTVALAACSKAASPAAKSPSAGGQTLAKLSDIPVGGAISAKGSDGADIILTRPAATTVAAFSAICTHQGCTVKPGAETFVCPCHGSTYDAKTGDRISGPARGGLSKVAVKVSGQDVVAG